MSSIDILALYRGIAQRALRLETRRRYAVSWEDQQLAAWRRGDPAPSNSRIDASDTTIREVTESGRRIARVRFVEVPLTEYERYEFEVGYPDNSAAGEEIHVVDRAVHPELDHVCDDFVLFDEAAVVWYRYDSDDHLTGYEYTDELEAVHDCLALADQALAAAVPYPEFLASIR